ncbi:hypothetical protein AALP_AA5G284100 [Arabis alpina]|uniref:Response regulatory domain-containing protein n=1 Tax=Arabis alpina TaxID=50452 RepID=A0A087GZY4_ARAAL|nr:hypothetical protein AALP_AA5G284100 [Arabis alpina]
MSLPSNILKEREAETCYNEIESLMDHDDDEDFPTTSGIRVLLVDADPNSLTLMKNLMAQFSYRVTYYENGEDALAFLTKNKHVIDLVIWDYHMPKINGLEALKTISKEMDLPVVIMSRDHKKDTVKKSTLYGACDFLVKPVSKEVVAVLWRHVFNKTMLSKSGLGKSVGSDSGGLLGQDNDDLYQNDEAEGSKNVEDSVEQNTLEQIGDKSSSKKRRMSWTPDLHHKFEVAVGKLSSLDKVFPKSILKCMQEELNVEGLTRNNVASHLQKYRQHAEKKSNAPQKTLEDADWRNAPLVTSKPLLNSNINLQTGLRYFVNDQTAANAPIQYPTSGPIQYPLSNYLTMNNNHFMTNPLANNAPYTDPFYQPEQQQQYYPSLQFPSVISKQDHGNLSSAMENMDLISYPDSSYDQHESFLPGYNNFDQNPRF